MKALKNGTVTHIQKSVDQLYNQLFLYLSKEASYLLGNDNEQHLLYIRNCYHQLASIIFNDATTNNWCITGNPGIGKTFFCHYLLYLLAQQNKTFIYHNNCYLKWKPLPYIVNVPIICTAI